MKKALSLALLFCFCIHAHAHDLRPLSHPTSVFARVRPLSGKPFIRNYNPKEFGAAFNYWAIAQDHRGVMYFGNWNGVLEYDGVSWRLVSTPNRSGVRSLAVDGHGRIFVGAVGDLGYLAPDSVGELRFVSLLDHVQPENREFNEVWYSYATSQGVYFRTDKILLRWANNRMQAWKPHTAFSGLFVVRDRVYIQQWEIGLLELVRDSLRVTREGKRFAHERIYAMLPYPGEKILVGTREQGLLLYDGASFQAIQTEPAATSFLRENLLSHGAVLQDGTFALATLRGGVAIIDPKGRLVQILDQAAGLLDHDVNFIFTNDPGVIWLAQGRGIARVETDSPLAFYGEAAGIKDFVSSILRHEGVLYVATGLGVFYLTSKSTPTNPLSSLPSKHAPEFRPVAGITAQCWYLLAAGASLLAATNDGVYQIKGAHATFLKKSVADSFFSMSLHRSKENPQRVWVGLRDGLASLRYDVAVSKWIDEGRVSGIHEPIWSIVENREGELWLGTEAQGVLRLSFLSGNHNATLQNKIQKIERFDSRHGLPKGWVGVYSAAARIVFTSDKGLFRFDRETNTFFPDSTFGRIFADGSRDVEVVNEDQQGNIWLGSEEAAEINRALRQPDGTYLPENGSALRLVKTAIWSIYPELDFAPPRITSAVWFGGPEGLLRYDVNIPRHDARVYPALIRRVTIVQEGAEDSTVFNGAMHENPAPSLAILAYAHNAVRFEFALPSFGDESGNQFQFYLEGFDQEWSAWSKTSEKSYTNLSEGDYRFRVRARDIYQRESAEAVYALQILPPWYRTAPAYLCYAIVAGASLLAWRRYDLRRQKKKAEHQRRAKELEEAHQLQLSLLPQQIPQLPHLELAAYMRPATEVGGDYYDFHAGEDGSLTVALGDATGHGLKAGTMVTAMKSLFIALAQESDLAQFFKQANHALRRINLRQIYMTLLLVRISDARLAICGAGMPPVLIHRAATRQVEEIDLKGMPLGSVPDFTYEQRRLQLAPGDVILLMSDGFTERFNPRRETLGYDLAKTVLLDVAQQSAQDIIQRFVQTGEAWGSGSPQNDDTTFVVIKIKE